MSLCSWAAPSIAHPALPKTIASISRTIRSVTGFFFVDCGGSASIYTVCAPCIDLLRRMVLCEADVAGFVAGLPSPPPHYVGFTTYLRQALMRGVAYRPPRLPLSRGRGKTRARTKARGLVLGRRLDGAFRRFAASGVSGSLTSVVAAVLRRRGIALVGSQPVVFDPRLRVKTALDGVGVDSGGTVWVIELKNTQHPLAEHRALYDAPCPNNAYLSNGQPNTERARHALQAGFGVLGFRRAFPRVPLRGLVVVNCPDGAVGYSVDCATYASPSAFPMPTAVVSPRSGGPWDPENLELRRLVSRLGFDVRTHRRTCAGTVGLYTPVAGRRSLAIGIGARSRRAVARQRVDVRAIVVSRGASLVAETL